MVDLLAFNRQPLVPGGIRIEICRILLSSAFSVFAGLCP